jgi:dynactin complex subunit
MVLLRYCLNVFLKLSKTHLLITSQDSTQRSLSKEVKENDYLVDVRTDERLILYCLLKELNKMSFTGLYWFII